MITKSFKTVDNRDIEFTIKNEIIVAKCGVFSSSFKKHEYKQMLELHSKILSPKTIKDVKAFIDKQNEPIQLNLFG